jgi:integral membrane protein (TIGR01906 family)
MDGSRVLTFFISIIAMLLLIVILLLTSIELVVFNLDFYRSEYQKLDRYVAIGISEGELLSVTRELLNYVRDKRQDLEVKAQVKGQERYVFNEREIAHMKDVKTLFMKGYKLRRGCIFILAIILILLYILMQKAIIRKLFGAFMLVSILLLILFGILFILINIDFTPYWDYFHYVFFNNDLWQLNPETDILIQMVPEQFFYDIIIRIALYFVGGMAILGVGLGSISMWIQRYKCK